jgi:hypothetical protein
MFDVTFLSAVVLWATSLLAPIRVTAALPSNELALGVMALPIAVVLESLIYSAAGNTPGKWILGIRVARIDQTRLPFTVALTRNLRCWVFGLGLGIPIVSLFTMVNAHGKAKRGEAQSWELATYSRCYSIVSSSTRTVIGALLAIALMVCARFVAAYGQTPKGALELAALGVNTRAPMQIDQETRLDAAVAGPGRLQYLYTLTKYEPTSPGATGEMARRRPNMFVGIHKRTCTNSEIEDLRRTGATFQYTYRDRLGVTVWDFTISPSDCNTNGTLLALASEVNATAPMKVDDVTRLDGAVAVGTTFRYLYTLTTDLSGVSSAVLAGLRNEMTRSTTQDVCSGDTFRWARENGATVEFVYRDTNGRTVVDVTVPTRDCPR